MWVYFTIAPSSSISLYSRDAMRLTALCFCGTLLALSLSWTTADAGEGDLLGGKGFGPCAATLRPAVPCGQEQDDSTCPYIFSLPPLTVHLPKQLRDLEKIMKDLQKLKDNVDQLRKMCEDCKVSQNERACGRQGEREYEMLTEAKHEHKNERNWMNERNPERLQENDRDLRQECGMDRVKVEKIMEGDGDVDLEKRMNLEENWEAEKESDKGIIKEKSPKEVAEKDGKNQVEGTEGEDKLWKSKVPVASENERAGVREMVVNINNKETDRDKEKDGKGHSNGERRDNLENRRERKITINVKNKVKTEESDHDVWRDQTKETEKKTPTKEDRGRDQIKMSEDHDGHTNREQEQSGEERKKEMEKRIKVERNNEKPKQTESTGRAEKETTIKEGEMEEDTEKGKEIKTEEKTVHSVQRDRDGELASSKAIERTDFVSISPTPQSINTLTQRPDFTDPDKAITITSSLPSPHLSSSTSHFITDVYEESTVTAYGLPTPTTDFWAAGITELPDAESDFGDSRPAIRATKIPRAGASSQGGVSSTTATSNTTNPHQNLNTTTFPGPAHHQNISSNTNTGVQSVAGQKQITSKYDHKPDQAPLPEKKPKDDQKHKPSPQKSTADQTSRPGKESKQVQRPDQNLKNNTVPKHGRDRATDENLENDQISEHGQDRTTGPSQVTTQKQSSHQKPNPPVQRPSSHQRPATVNTTSSDKEPESKEITIFNQNSKPVLPFKTTKPDQEKKTDIKSRSKEKTKPDQRSKLNQDRTSVQDPRSGRSQTISHTTKPNQKFVTELMKHFDQNPSEPKSVKDPMSGQKPKNPKIPQMNQKPKPVQLPKFNRNHPKLVTDQKTKPNVKPKQNQGLQTNKVPRPTQIPNLNSKSVIDQISSTASNKTTKQWPLPRLRPPSRPALQPGATPAQTPKLAVQSKPSRKAKTHIDPPQISRTITDKIQNSDMPPTSPPVKQTAEMSHSPEDTEFSPSTMKTISPNPKASNSLEAAPFPYLQALPKGYTMIPDSRIVSDLRPQTPGQPSAIPITSKPNKGIHGILPTVIPSANPGFTKPNPASNVDTTLQTKILHHGEEKATSKMMTSVPSSSAEPTSTVSAGFRSTTPASSGPEAPAAESSTSSARELRVKIKQMAALPKNSLSPQGRPSDKRLKEHPEDSQGASTPSTVIPSEVTIARRDCSDLLLLGETKSGVYLVTPDIHSSSFPVFCDMEHSGGGWTVLQRRQDGSVSFNRTWAEYRAGFGELDGGEFWLGNDMIHLLTWNRDMMLFVELEDFDGVMEYAQYDQFRVASERMRYRLTVKGYSGTAGDALRYSRSYDHNNRAFTTPDRDHDRYPSGNCGAYYSSGWWFDACLSANLNGKYYVRSYKGIRDGIFWGTWHNILTEHYPTNDRQAFKTVRMMIRPKGFTP